MAVLAGSVLQLWRSPSFRGDETLSVGALFDRQYAEIALKYAERAQRACFGARAYALELGSNLAASWHCDSPLRGPNGGEDGVVKPNLCWC